MKDMKIKDIENSIKSIETRIEQINRSIKRMMFKGKAYKLNIETLKKEREEMEGELMQGDTNSFNKLVSYKEIREY